MSAWTWWVLAISLGTIFWLRIRIAVLKARLKGYRDACQLLAGNGPAIGADGCTKAFAAIGFVAVLALFLYLGTTIAAGMQ